MDTDQIIVRLARDAPPVRRLARPMMRAALWMALALGSAGVLVWAVSPRPDLGAKMIDLRYVVEQIAALLTAATAAFAAFTTTVPGQPRGWIALPAVPLAIWLGSIGLGCLSDLLRAGSGFQSDWMCFPAIMMIGAVPAVAMVVMLRAGAPLLPRTSIALGGLAAAALGDFGLRLFHTADGGLMVLVWQIGSVFILTAIAGRAGSYMMRWQHLKGLSR
ncbi:NrsF family protein [Tardiphaga sp.]|uniref:NrsF family protein n=1 Tax=Tardiphaga sp. TaxID=1926292 RepID=UPI0025F71614|nr:NrsF family protein [Tardiphaga sp.]